MKCPKCGYTSFPYVGSCGKCGRQLADARELYGVYAFPPNPPDLMLAHELVQMESTDTVPRDSVSSPAIDLSQLHEIALELASPHEATPDAVEGQMQPEVTEDSLLALDVDLLRGKNTSSGPVEPPADSAARQDVDLHPALDLSGFADLTLEHDHVSADPPPPLHLDQPPTPTDVEQVFELDLDDEDEPLSLTPVEEGLPVNDDDAEDDPEYILEIEEELELEELDLEDDLDDEARDEDENDER